MPASGVRVAGEAEGPGEADPEERMADAQGPAELACHPPGVGDGFLKPHTTSL